MIINSVFVSGSISIKKLPSQVQNSIQAMIDKRMTILVGDAPGIDTLVQDLCNTQKYLNVIVYTITSSPRYKANKDFQEKNIFVDQEIKKERERQTYKDKAMSEDSEFSLVVWDGSSKGSYANISRALESNKKVKVFYQDINDYLPPEKITPMDLEFIYRENNGYTASEVVEYLQNNGIEIYQRSQDLNKFLINENLLVKDGTVYQPTKKSPELFIVEMYRGKPRGVKFNNQFIDWIEGITSKSKSEQSLFDF
ncbi:hypothetical protein PGH07_01170 [Sulfurovum sp. zt1-1]|uniref:Uncharacterized protein n=1 Tax=Sulfurovum zhangzhouensis TaxID=3019067 RepID=A0ABT7QVB8_9BACT|nr:hypothetical protein [Sulfurovum zhangzhouensis]MDM5270782.1 hypothetical protein [Sulfurovum zhangzhouensis]